MEAIKYKLSTSLSINMDSLFKDNSIYSITDSLGRIEYANNNYCHILESDPQMLIGESHELLKSHLHSGKLYKKLWRTIKMGNKWNGVLSDKSSSGKQFWLDTTIIPIRDEVENEIKYVSIYKDVTTYNKEIINLQESDSSNNSFLQSMPLNVFAITRHGMILKANKGYDTNDPSNLIGTYLYDYFNPISYGLLRKNIDKVYKDKITHQFEFYDLDSNFKKVLFSAIISPNFNELGVVISSTIAFHKITAFKGVSDKLIESEAKFRTIYQSINVGIIVVTDNQGNITEWNKGAQLAFGYDKIEIIGKPLTVLISKEYKKATINALLRAVKKIKNNQNADIIEMCCLRKNGEKFPVEFALSLSYIDGKAIYCAMMLDISKRKKLETRLKQKTKDLELFLYRSAHDLKAPFSSAKGLINLLKEEINNKKSHFLIEMLEATINSGRVLTDDLSEASIISAKKHDNKNIDFHKCIEEVLTILNGSENFEHIKFNIEVDVNETFKSTPELIKSILQNLIQNAIKYSKKPSKKHEPYIDITIKTSIKEVIINVCDNGIGIHPKSIDKIFDLYYRCNNDNVQGNGLGLYIVKSIIDGLNGTITVKNKSSSVTCFEIHLPNIKK